MNLLDRLRRRWGRRDAEKRAEAVRQMGKEDQSFVEAAARRDDDVRVRRIAVKKLADPDVLLEIARADPDEGLRKLAAERAAAMLVQVASSEADVHVCRDALSKLGDPRHRAEVALSAFHAGVRRAALCGIEDARVLGRVARKSSDPELRHEALQRIGDWSVLRSVAVGDSPSELAVAAVDRIDDPETLDAIAEERTAQRIVRERALRRLEEVVPGDHPVRVRRWRKRQIEICSAVEALVDAGAPQKAAEQLYDLAAEWEKLAAHAPPEPATAERFQKARQALTEQLAVLAKREAERQRRAREMHENLAARQALCQRVEELDGADAPRGLEEARAAWEELGPVPPVGGEALATRFSQACQQCEKRYRKWAAREELRCKLQELVAGAEELAQSSRLPEAARELEKLRERWGRLERSLAASGQTEELRALQERFANAGLELEKRAREKEERQEQERQANLGELRELCARAERMVSGETLSLRAADRELRALTAALKGWRPLPAAENSRAWRERLSELRRQLLRKISEEKEAEAWKRWVTADLQEKLVEKLESLLQADDIASAERELREVEREWKRLAVPPHGRSEAVWQRFRQARDAMLARCEEYFADNLRKKIALCEEVERLADSRAWKETAEAIKRIQAAWKEIGPVPRREAKPLWQRFRAACDRFFARRKEHFEQLRREREENARKKRDLCARAEALADSTDWDSAAREMRKLQDEWKQIGPVPTEDSETLWRRFREACNRFSDQRRRRGDRQKEETLALAQAMCAGLESLASSLGTAEGPAPSEVAEKLCQSWTAWRRLGSLPEEKTGELKRRLCVAWERIAAACPESLHGTPFDPRTNHKKREKLCARLEELLRAHAERSAASPPQDVAQRLRYSLAANRLGGSPVPEWERDWQAALEEVQQLKASWERMGPAVGEEAKALADRFSRACADLEALRQTREAGTVPA